MTPLDIAIALAAALVLGLATRALASATLGSPRAAWVAGGLALLAAIGLVAAFDVRVLVAVALAALAFLGARWDDDAPVLAFGAPVLALAAAWASLPVGFAALVGLTALHAARFPILHRLRPATAPQLAGLLVALVVAIALPDSLLPAPRSVRALVVVVALALNVGIGSWLLRARLGPSGRRAASTAVALLAPLALLAALVAGERAGLLDGARGTVLLVAGAVAAVATAAALVLAFALVLDTRNDAKGWMLASLAGALVALPLGAPAVVLAAPAACVLLAVLALRAARGIVPGGRTA